MWMYFTQIFFFRDTQKFSITVDYVEIVDRIFDFYIREQFYLFVFAKQPD